MIKIDLRFIGIVGLTLIILIVGCGALFIAPSVLPGAVGDGITEPPIAGTEPFVEPVPPTTTAALPPPTNTTAAAHPPAENTTAAALPPTEVATTTAALYIVTIETPIENQQILYARQETFPIELKVIWTPLTAFPLFIYHNNMHVQTITNQTAGSHIYEFPTLPTGIHEVVIYDGFSKIVASRTFTIFTPGEEPPQLVDQAVATNFTSFMIPILGAGALITIVYRRTRTSNEKEKNQGS